MSIIPALLTVILQSKIKPKNLSDVDLAAYAKKSKAKKPTKPKKKK